MYEHLLPADRATRYEDPLDAYLHRHSLGRLTGAGTQAGENAPIVFVQLELELDSARDIDLVAAKLDECGAPLGSQLHVVTDDGTETRVCGTTECMAVFIDGQTLPLDVYASSDVNVLIAKLQAALAKTKAGDLRSYWEGTAETGLFFFGASADAMVAATWPVLANEALAQNARIVKRYGHHPQGPAEARVPLATRREPS